MAAPPLRLRSPPARRTRAGLPRAPPRGRLAEARELGPRRPGALPPLPPQRARPGGSKAASGPAARPQGGASRAPSLPPGEEDSPPGPAGSGTRLLRRLRAALRVLPERDVSWLRPRRGARRGGPRGGRFLGLQDARPPQPEPRDARARGAQVLEAVGVAAGRGLRAADRLQLGRLTGSRRCALARRLRGRLHARLQVLAPGDGASGTRAAPDYPDAGPGRGPRDAPAGRGRCGSGPTAWPRRGVLVRHLVMPGLVEESDAIFAVARARGLAGHVRQRDGASSRRPVSGGSASPTGRDRVPALRASAPRPRQRHADEEVQADLAVPPRGDLPSACRRVARGALAEPFALRPRPGRRVRVAVPRKPLAFHDEAIDGVWLASTPARGPGSAGPCRCSPPRCAGLLRNLSIRRKLTVIVMLTSGVAVILASALFPRLGLRAFRAADGHRPRDHRRGPRPSGLPCARRGERVERREHPGAGDARPHRGLPAGLPQHRARASIFDANGRAVGGQERNILQAAAHSPVLRPQHPRVHRRGPRPLPPGHDARGPLRGRHLPPLEHAGAQRPASSATWASSPG